jgi:hypothetical protein
MKNRFIDKILVLIIVLNFKQIASDKTSNPEKCSSFVESGIVIYKGCENLIPTISLKNPKTYNKLIHIFKVRKFHQFLIKFILKISVILKFEKKFFINFFKDFLISVFFFP